MRSSMLFLLVALVVVSAATLPAPSRAMWVPVPDVNDVVIKQVGQFAVLVYGIAHRKDLAFVGVVCGDTEDAVGGGTNYRLLVVVAAAATNPGDDVHTAEYECLVWGVPGSRADTWKLRRFRKLQRPT